MNSSSDAQGQPQRSRAFYICHHDANRVQVTSQSLAAAVNANYDTLTVPITTDAFQTRVTALLSNHIYDTSTPDEVHRPCPIIDPLNPADTHLAPSPIVPQLLGIISPWIDLCSPDPAVYEISKQVLEIEVAYASFCGISAVIVPVPKLHHGSRHGGGISQYAYALKEVMATAAFMQFSVLTPMMDNPAESFDLPTGLCHLARSTFIEPSGDQAQQRRQSVDISRRHDFFGTWDSWNVMRSVCKYSNRLFVALIIPRYLPHSGICARWQSEPLRVVYMDTPSFFSNPSGYPVLTSNHRALISLYMRLRSPPCIVLTGVSLPGGDLVNGSGIVSNQRSSTNPSVSETVVDDPANGPTPAEAQLQDSGRHRTDRSGLGKVKDPSAYLSYLRWFQNNQPPKTRIEINGSGYEDYLQAPLQPLAQNLESLTYEVFEQDPIKYDLYEKAILAALKDWRDQKKPASGRNGRVVMAVVGAGRGPLVNRALKASRESGVPVDMWALEKNPNAFVLLRRHNATTWNNQVKLVQSDMRSWQGPSTQTSPAHIASPSITSSSTTTQQATYPHHYPIDIVISELLGSFADNELSPECLDGIIPLLQPEHGISIPQSYSAWLTPIAAPKLHADLIPRSTTDSSAFNTPYVVLLQSHDYLSTKSHTSAYGPDVCTLPATEAQSRPSVEFHSGNTADDSGGTHVTKAPMPTVKCAWSFHHQSRSSTSSYPNRAYSSASPPSSAQTSSTSAWSTPRHNAHNTRHVRLSFDLRHRGVCHGLAGYFEAVLYPGVELSTNPLTMSQKSADMMSWFPIFFPLRSPLHAPDHSSLVVELWRATDNRKVWYEWLVEAWTNSSSSVAGASLRLNCSDLMSSKDQGCLL